MKTEIRELWTAALRSGKYKQGTGALSAYGKHCCLGVLSELAVEAGVIDVDREVPTPVRDEVADLFGGSEALLPEKVVLWAGLDSDNPELGERRASTWNDFEGKSFEEIADLIDEHLKEETK